MMLSFYSHRDHPSGDLGPIEKTKQEQEQRAPKTEWNLCRGCRQGFISWKWTWLHFKQGEKEPLFSECEPQAGCVVCILCYMLWQRSSWPLTSSCQTLQWAFELDCCAPSSRLRGSENGHCSAGNFKSLLLLAPVNHRTRHSGTH